MIEPVPPLDDEDGLDYIRALRNFCGFICVIAFVVGFSLLVIRELLARLGG